MGVAYGILYKIKWNIIWITKCKKGTYPNFINCSAETKNLISQEKIEGKNWKMHITYTESITDIVL